MRNLEVEDFFVVRLPKLPISVLKDIPFNRDNLTEYLKNWLKNPDVLNAVYIASPSLIERIELWEKEPYSKSGLKVTQALLKYLIRMSSRATPFGLFSGIASGVIGSKTVISSGRTKEDKRSTRLDMYYLAAVRDYLSAPGNTDISVPYKVNPTLYSYDTKLHYIEPYSSSGIQKYRLSSVDKDIYLEKVIELAESSIAITDLALIFCKTFENSVYEDVLVYLNTLIEEKILLVNLKLPITSGYPDRAFCQSIKENCLEPYYSYLSGAVRSFESLDLAEGSLLKGYKNVFDSLKRLPINVEEKKLFQTDVLRSLESAELSSEIPGKILKVLRALKILKGKSPNPLKHFIQEFNQRFEGQFVPLLVALDEECGVSFSAKTGYDTPLLAGINISGYKNKSKNNPLEKILRSRFDESKNTANIKLESRELLKVCDEFEIDQQLPFSFAALATIYHTENGELIHLKGCFGPSAANILGRFCHLDETLQKNVEKHLRKEERHSPDVIFAEIIHLPDGRPGNVIARPSLRKFEIVFFADTLKEESNQILVNDLFVYVEDNKIKLWSKRLNKQVIPRLSSAHNYNSNSLGIYRFLCMIQHQETDVPSIYLPKIFEGIEYIPRLVIDNVIVREAEWNIERTKIESLIKDDKLHPDAWRCLVKDYKMEQWVVFSVHDNALTLNLKNLSMVNLLLSETRNQKYISLKEALIVKYQSPIKGYDGEYAHELVIPFSNYNSKSYESHSKYIDSKYTPIASRFFQPGSEWISIKIYAQKSTAELILVEHIYPLVEHFKKHNLFQNWFFIRYGDPEWHLRIRFYGDPEKLYSELLQQLRKVLEPLIHHRMISKFELFAYEREVERYGGNKSILYAEQIFEANSLTVLQSLKLLGEFGEKFRSRIALLLVNSTLEEFGYLLNQKLKLISTLRKAFGKEFNEDKHMRKQIGQKYSDYRALIQNDFNSTIEEGKVNVLEQNFTNEIIKTYSETIRPFAKKILILNDENELLCSVDTLLSSILHMSNNRIFKAYGREQEFITYDFLRRIYIEQQARHKIIESSSFVR